MISPLSARCHASATWARLLQRSMMSCHAFRSLPKAAPHSMRLKRVCRSSRSMIRRAIWERFRKDNGL